MFVEKNGEKVNLEKERKKLYSYIKQVDEKRLKNLDTAKIISSINKEISC